jgi:dihydropteridine reductase
VLSVDYARNDAASGNILLPTEAAGVQATRLEETRAAIVQALGQQHPALGPASLQAIINVAGGWAGGGLQPPTSFLPALERMLDQNVHSAALSLALAATHLAPGGVITLIGAHAALGPTPGMLAYGASKAATHHLVRSVGHGSAKETGLPPGAILAALLPATLDTPNNRKWMPHADTSTWTPLDVVAGRIVEWARTPDPATHGQLYSVLTGGGETRFVQVA